MMENKVAGIILAAGGSKRLGRPKQLLDWFGKTLVEHIIDVAKEAKLDPIIVVTGSHHEIVEGIVEEQDVIFARNEQWENGQSGSLIKGIEELENYSPRPFIFLLCDQPQVTPELVERLKTAAKESDNEIVMVKVDDITSPPILFKPVCIESLVKLTGDQGGKGLTQIYKTKYISWKDDRLINDIDTEEDYLKLKSKYAN